jgi:hypothetical protein
VAAKTPIERPSRARIQAKKPFAPHLPSSPSFQEASITTGVRITVSSTSVSPMPSRPSA